MNTYLVEHIAGVFGDADLERSMEVEAPTARDAVYSVAPDEVQSWRCDGYFVDDEATMISDNVDPGMCDFWFAEPIKEHNPALAIFEHG